VYAWNTLGAIVGSFGTGFLLLPSIGAEWTLRLVVLSALALAFGSLLAEVGRIEDPLRRPRRAGGGRADRRRRAVAAVGPAPAGSRGLLRAPAVLRERRREIVLDRIVSDYTLMTFTEGYNETITSFRTARGSFITINGSPTRPTSSRTCSASGCSGTCPWPCTPGPWRRWCVVGLGAGVTAGAIGVHAPKRWWRGAGARGAGGQPVLRERNHAVLDNPALRLVIDDGRTSEAHPQRFDVISSHPNFPSLTGSGRCSRGTTSS